MAPGRRFAAAATLALCAAGLVSCTADEEGEPMSVLPLVPAPQHATALDGEPFRVGASTAVVALLGTQAPAARVADALGVATGRDIPVWGADATVNREADGLVVLALAGDLPEGDEAYRLTADATGVRLTARTVDGLHRAASTLAQLVVMDSHGVSIPAVEIEDAPRYAWRGLSVDVARHFFPVEDLEVLVDLIADYKLNVLHVHLTDDQGWRIDLPSRPELVERSSGTAVGGEGGYYTADDWAGLVAYAAARGVSVVPEIDVPGHVNAALHAIPELNESGEAADEYTGIEVGFSGLHASLPATGPFLADVFGDIAAMTPGDYVHIGGDEADEVAPDEYARLVAAAAAEVRASGKQVIGWQEIANAPLEPGTVVQYWRELSDPAPVVAAGDAGARVLMSPASRTYLDMKYDAAYPLGQDWAAVVELRDAYDWDPGAYLPGLDPAAVIGVEAAIWTETLSTRDELTQMLLPRLAAVAEVAWSASTTDFDDFADRVATHGRAWDRAGLAWYPSPQVDWA